MDKRAIKSKNAIIATFLALIKTKPVERLTVKELCEKARINKSTFYAHYHDLQDLSAQLEAELVCEILPSLPRNDLYSLKTSELFAVDLYQALIRYEPQIELLFPNQKKELLASRLDRAVKTYVWNKYPHLRNRVETEILLTYQIQGAYYTFLNSRNEDQTIVQEVIGRIARALHTLY